MSDFTPTTQYVRAAFWRDQCPPNDIDIDDIYNAGFDRWLAQHEAEVKVKALREAAAEVEKWVDEDVKLGVGRHPSQTPHYSGVRRAASTVRDIADRIEKGLS